MSSVGRCAPRTLATFAGACLALSLAGCPGCVTWFSALDCRSEIVYGPTPPEAIERVTGASIQSLGEHPLLVVAVRLHGGQERFYSGDLGAVRGRQITLAPADIAALPSSVTTVLYVPGPAANWLAPECLWQCRAFVTEPAAPEGAALPPTRDQMEHAMVLACETARREGAASLEHTPLSIRIAVAVPPATGRRIDERHNCPNVLDDSRDSRVVVLFGPGSEGEEDWHLWEKVRFVLLLPFTVTIDVLLSPLYLAFILSGSHIQG